MMKAASVVGLRRITVGEHPIPDIGPREALIRVKACGICPHDIRVYQGLKNSPEPGISGHEVAGDVVRIGEEVKGVSVGDRVVPDICIPCLECKFCRMGRFNICVNKGTMGGGYAEYMKALASNLHHIPEDLAYEEACLTEPLACCLNANVRSHVEKGDDVVIIGAGPIGLMHLQLAKASGARAIIVDLRRARLEAAKSLGADETVDATEIDAAKAVKAMTDGYGADVVIVAVGNKIAIESGLQMVSQGGQVTLFGAIYPPAKIEVDPNMFHYGETVLTGDYDYTPWLFGKALKLISTKIVRVKPLIGQILPLDLIGDAFKIAESQESLKVVISPQT